MKVILGIVAMLCALLGVFFLLEWHEFRMEYGAPTLAAADRVPGGGWFYDLMGYGDYPTGSTLWFQFPAWYVGAGLLVASAVFALSARVVRTSGPSVDVGSNRS